MINIPRYEIPHFFSRFVDTIFTQTLKRAIIASVPYVKNAMFFRELSLASYQFVAQIGTFDKYSSTLSAGLPHFTTGWTRVWGRDTFISFKGIFLLNGLYNEAKNTIF
jgi:glycogen debranching enzyme